MGYAVCVIVCFFELDGSVAAAAEDEQRDDQDPDPVIAQEIAQTAVIHMKSSVHKLRVGSAPCIIIL